MGHREGVAACGAHSKCAERGDATNRHDCGRDPVTLSYDDVDADTEKIMQAIMDLLPEASRNHGNPTKQEIALAMPPGHKVVRQNEKARRPGSD